MPRQYRYEAVVNKTAFTRREDLALKQAYDLYKSTPNVWDHCAKSVGRNRTAIQCKHRYTQWLAPGLDRVTPWSNEEDARLRKCICEHHRLSSEVIQEYFPTRPYDYMRSKLRSVNMIAYLASSQRGMQTRRSGCETSGHQNGEGRGSEHESQDADEIEIVSEKAASPSSQASSSSASSSVSGSTLLESIPSTLLTPPRGTNTSVELARLLFTAPHTSIDSKVDAGNVLFGHMFELASGSPERLDLAKHLFVAGSGVIAPDMLHGVEAVILEYVVGHNSW